MAGRRGLKKQAGQEVAIFQQTAANFRQGRLWVLKILIQSHILHFWMKIFRQFSDRPKFKGRGNCPPPPLCHDATGNSCRVHQKKKLEDFWAKCMKCGVGLHTHYTAEYSNLLLVADSGQTESHNHSPSRQSTTSPIKAFITIHSSISPSPLSLPLGPEAEFFQTYQLANWNFQRLAG